MYSRFYIDKSMYVAAFIFALAFHGLLLGIGWNNSPVKIATDTIPLLVGAINILLACELKAYQGFSCARLEAVNLVFALIMVIVGVIAFRSGRLSVISLGGAESSAVSLSIIAVSFWRRKHLGVVFVTLNLAILAITAPFITRTILAFVIVITVILFFTNIVKSPLRLYLFFLLIGAFSVCAPMLIQPDSPLGRRIQDLNSEELQQQRDSGTGSIGDREEEWTVIKKKISDDGDLARMFGLGHGAVYDIDIDGITSTEYSNAHYGWALFYLRYGYFGFIYLMIYTIFIMLSFMRNMNSNDDFNRFIALLCVAALLYIFTFMAFNILLFGLQFMHKRQPAQS